jgi:hypothetical protein
MGIGSVVCRDDVAGAFAGADGSGCVFGAGRIDFAILSAAFFIKAFRLSGCMTTTHSAF